MVNSIDKTIDKISNFEIKDFLIMIYILNHKKEIVKRNEMEENTPYKRTSLTSTIARLMLHKLIKEGVNKIDRSKEYNLTSLGEELAILLNSTFSEIADKV